MGSLLFFIAGIFFAFAQAPPCKNSQDCQEKIFQLKTELHQLDEDALRLGKGSAIGSLARDQCGNPLVLSYNLTPFRCAQGLPTARDYMEYAEGLGAKGIRETGFSELSIKDPRVVKEIQSMKDSFYVPVFKEEPHSHRSVDFYFSVEGYLPAVNNHGIRSLWAQSQIANVFGHSPHAFFTQGLLVESSPMGGRPVRCRKTPSENLLEDPLSLSCIDRQDCLRKRRQHLSLIGNLFFQMERISEKSIGEVLRDGCGKPVLRSSRSALQTTCLRQNSRLPHTFEFAQFAVKNGAQGLKATQYPELYDSHEKVEKEILEFKKQGYAPIYRFGDSGGVFVAFYYSAKGYTPPLGFSETYWTADLYPKAAARKAYGFHGPSGKIISATAPIHQVRCIDYL